MDINSEIDELRKPVTQLLSLFALFMVFFAYLTFFNGLDYDKLPFYLKGITIINVVATYNAMFAFSNVFYFMAIQNNVDLYGYWLLYVVTMVISFALWSLGSILVWIELPRLKKYMSGKTKTFIGLGLLFVSQFIYIEKIIEYILVPNIADSKFAVAGSMLVLIGIFVVAIEWVRKYANFKIHVLKE